MNKAFNNLVIFNGYPLAIVVAVTMHAMLLMLLLLLLPILPPDMIGVRLT